ncbi:hypothetical protein [Nannocystis radixulma]|uniref:Cell surface protein n=1 Tax=Nannocystis radixulma TaxID=2995305 RepID=A0ABT5B1T3_9BACT|nr:hypothetical protein [Nannocystis radixulma]MDC0667117.1 hypothetical protein [Nannocystis radixulma]
MTRISCVPILVLTAIAACSSNAPADTDTGTGTGTGTGTVPDTDGASSTTTSTSSTTDTPTTTDPTIGDDSDPHACQFRPGAEEEGVEWYFLCGGPGGEHVDEIAIDAEGNIYLGIELSEPEPGVTLRFGEFEVTPGGLTDVVFLKLSPAGAPLWLRAFAGPGEQRLSSFKLCGDGFVAVGDAAAGSLDLGGGALPGTAWIGSFAVDGTHRWSRTLVDVGENSGASFSGLDCDGAGRIVTTGRYSRGVDFGEGPLQPALYGDGFVAMFDDSGATVWARPFNGTGDRADGGSVAFTPAGEVVFTGTFNESVDLGGGLLTSIAVEDMLLAKLDGNGGHVWSQRIGGPGSHYGVGVAVDSAGQIGFGGLFTHEVDIGPAHYENPNPEDFSVDALLAGFDPAGEVQWSRVFSSADSDRIGAMEFDPGGALFVHSTIGESLSLLLFAGSDQTWEWKTEQLNNGSAALAGSDAVILGAWPGLDDVVDFGGGPLVGRGNGDIFLVKVRR